MTHDLARAAEARGVTHDLARAAEARGVTHDLARAAEARGVTHDLARAVEARGVTENLVGGVEEALAPEADSVIGVVDDWARARWWWTGRARDLKSRRVTRAVQRALKVAGGAWRGKERVEDEHGAGVFVPADLVAHECTRAAGAVRFRGYCSGRST